MPANWKTSLLGVFAIVAAISGAGTAMLHNQPVDWNSLAAAILVGLGLIKAEDAK